MDNFPKISPELLQQYQEQIAKRSSESTVKRKGSSLRKFFSWAEDEGHIEKSPFKQIQTPSLQVKENWKGDQEILVRNQASYEPGMITRKANKFRFPVSISSLFKISGVIGLAVMVFAIGKIIKVPIPFLPAPASQETFMPQPLDEESTQPTPPPLVKPSPSPKVDAEEKIDMGNLEPYVTISNDNLGLGGSNVSLKTFDSSDGDIEINPDGSGTLNILFEGFSGNFLNVQNANLVTGSLYYGNVSNSTSNYYLLKLDSGSTSTTKFSVDAKGNVLASGNLNLSQGNLQIGGVTRFNSSGRLASITGYYQDSGLFEIDQGAPDYARITKSGVSASNDLLTLKIDETGKTSSNYDTLVLERINPGTTGYALFVKSGNSAFAGHVYPNENTTYDLGSSSLRWRKLWAEDADFSDDVTISDTLTVAGSLVVQGTTLATTGNIETTGNLEVDGNTTLGDSSSDTLTVNATSTFNAQGIFKHAPTGAHTGTWAQGSSTWNHAYASIYINPGSATGDSNLLTGAVAGSVMFSIDAEGDIFAKNLVLTGTTTTGTTTVTGDLSVEGNTTLGDTTSDTLTFTARVVQDSDLIPITTTGTNDLGSSSLQWDNLYVNNVVVPTTATGQVGYWTRTSGVLSPVITNDVIAATTSATVALTLTQTGAFNAFLVEDEVSDITPFVIDQSGNVGVGDSGPDAILEILGTTEQLRLTNTDGTVDARFTVDSNGDLTLDVLGAGTIEQLILTNGDVINIGGSGSTDVAYNVIGDSTSGASASMNSDDDLYIEGDLEVDGSSFFQAITITSCTGCQTAWSSITAPSGDLPLSHGTNVTTMTTSATTQTFWTFTGSAFTTGEMLDVTGTWVPSAGGTQSAIDINLTNNPSVSANTLRGLDLVITDADDNANTLYGVYGTVDNSGNTSAGTHSIYGGYFTATGKAAGTTTAIGLYTTATGADSNYAAIFDAGNVGIGTTSPLAKLHINSLAGGEPTYHGDLIINNSGGGLGLNNTQGIEFKTSSSTSGFGWRISNPDFLLGNTPLVFETRNDSATWSEKMRIDKNGYVGIGNVSPAGKLDVSGAVTGKALIILNETGDQNILTASASGVPRASIERSGDYKMFGPKAQVTIASTNDVFVYDTGADSDGGKWTDSDRTRSSSWYNETIDATGANCTIATDDRCGQKAFPKKAVIVADASNVRIYDAETQTMWMRFAQGTTALGADANNNPATVFALNGRVYIGTTGSSATGLYVIDFIADTIRRYNATNRSIFTPGAGAGDNGGVSNRNASATYIAESTIMKLPSSVVNDVKAARVADKDYIAAGTNGGSTGSVSLIQEDTRIIGNFGHTTATVAATNVFLTSDGTLYYTYRDQNSLANDKLKVNYAAHKKLPVDADVSSRDNIPADVVYGNVSTTNYGVAFGDSTAVATAVTNPDFIPGPGFPTTTPVINDLFVTKGTSTADPGRSNAIYMADNAAGLIRIDEYQSRLEYADRLGNPYTTFGYPVNEQKGSAKYYTKDYITESQYGDIRGIWGFNNNAASDLEDLSVKGNNLTNNGTVTFTAVGVRGNSATFTEGSSQSLSSSSTSLLPNSAISVGAWVNPTTISGNDVIISKSGDTTNKAYRLYLNAGKPTFEVSENGSNVVSVASTNALTTSTWNHVVGVFQPADRNQGGRLELYVNGIKVANSFNIPNYLYNSPSVFRIGNDDQSHTNVVGTALDGTFKIITGPNNTQFKIGDFVNVRNTTTAANTQTVVTATASTTVTVLDAVGTATTDQTIVTKVNYTNTVEASDTDATFKIHEGPSQEDFDIGDFVEAYDSLGTTLKTQTVISAVSETNVTTLLAIANAITDDIYITKLNTTKPKFGTDLDATFKIITGPNQNEFSVGDFVSVGRGSNGAAAPTVQTLSVVTAVSSTTVTVLDAVGTGTTQDTWTVKANKVTAVAGTATSSTIIGTGTNNTNFAVGDFVELYNSTRSEKAQTTVTATSATTITVAAGTASQVNTDTVYVAKLSVGNTPTEFLDAKLDDAFVTATALTADQVKAMFETGLSASQNHTASRITGVTGANTYQQLSGAGSAAATVSKVNAIAVDDQNQRMYVGSNDGSGNTGGVSVIGVNSDTLIDLYDDTNNTTKKDDSGTQFDETDAVAISIHGGEPRYLAIAGTNDTTTKVWLENSDITFKSHIANNFNPHGANLEQTNLKVDNTLFLGSSGLANLTAIASDVKLSGNLQITGKSVFQGPILPNSTRTQFRNLFTGSSLHSASIINMALGADNLPRIVLTDGTNDWLYYLRCLNSTCTSYVSNLLDDGDTSIKNNNTAQGAKIVIGPNNLPYIAYDDRTDDAVTYIRCLDQDCENRVKRVVYQEDGLVNALTLSMKVNSQGYPVFAFPESTTGKLHFIFCGDMDCNQVTDRILGEASANADLGTNIVMALDSNNNPIIAYQEPTDLDLWVTACNDPYCNTYTTTVDVVATNSVGHDISIAVGTDNFPRIVYHDITVTDKYVFLKCNNAQCSSPTSLTIDSNVSTTSGADSPRTTIVMDGSNNSYVTYTDQTNQRLKFAQINNTPAIASGPTIVDDPTDNVGNNPSIRLTSDGLPVITYINTTQSGVRLANCGDATCTSGNTTQDIFSYFDNTNTEGTLDVDMAIGNDNMTRLVYNDETNDNLLYIRCLNLACAGMVVTTVDSTNDVGDDPRIAIAPDGFARIAYSDTTNTDLKYAQCTNDNCSSSTLTSFSSSQAPNDNETTLGLGNSIAIGKDGFTRILTRGATQFNTIFIRCLNDACSAFHANEVTDGTITTFSDRQTAMILDPNDFASVLLSGEDGVTNYLLYSHCSDLDCAATDAVDAGTTVASGAGAGPLYIDVKLAWNPLLNTPMLLYRLSDESVTAVIVCDNYKDCSVNTSTTLSTTAQGVYGLAIDPTTQLPVAFIRNGTVAQATVVRCSDEYCFKQAASAIYPLTPTQAGALWGKGLIRQVDGQSQYVLAVANTSALSYIVSTATVDLGNLDHQFGALFVNQLIAKNTTVAGFDLAEDYVASEPLSAGDVVSFDTHASTTVRKSISSYDPRLAGIVSSQPGLLLQDPDKKSGVYPISLSGHVPVKIDPDSDPISVGDFLTSSDKPGLAMKATKAGYTVGKALESWKPCDSSSSTLPLSCSDKIEVFVHLGYFDPDLALTDTGDLKIEKVIATSDTTEVASDSEARSALDLGNVKNAVYKVVRTTADGGEIVTERIGSFANLVVANIKAGAIESNDVSTHSFIALQGVIDNLLVSGELVSPIVQTKTISPLADESNVTIKIGKSKSALEEDALDSQESSESGKLIVENSQGSEVASIDETGHIKASSIEAGKIYADELVSPTLESQKLTLEEIQEVLRKVEEDQKLLSETATWSTNTASTSDDLSELAVASLYVTETAAVNSLSVTNLLSIGSDFVIQSTADTTIINTLSSPLSIQSLALAPVEIMAGLVKINTNGDVEIAGNLYVAGRVEAQGLSLKPKDESFGDILSIEDSSGNQVGRLTASGSAEFSELTTDSIIIASNSEDAPVSAIGTSEISTNATAGKASIPYGGLEITIRNPKINSNTLVYVTPTSSTNNKTLYVKAKDEGFFTVGFSDPAESEVSFNWWVIEIK